MREITLDSLKCQRVQDWFGADECRLEVVIDGSLVAQLSYQPSVRTVDDLKLAETVYKGKTYRIDREPTPKELDDLLFGWMVEAGVTSNSVIYVKDQVTVGIGTGEQDRVGVAQIARDKAYRKLADRFSYERHGVIYSSLDDEQREEDLGRNRGEGKIESFHPKGRHSKYNPQKGRCNASSGNTQPEGEMEVDGKGPCGKGAHAHKSRLTQVDLA